jgi:hypothetical protein
MGNTASKTKQQWNAAHLEPEKYPDPPQAGLFPKGKARYTQVKISVDPVLAAAFKAACAASGESMASALSRHMAAYSKAKGNKKPPGDYSTRQRRRRAVGKIIVSLEAIKQAEEAYAGNIPENLQNSVRYDDAEQSVSVLEDAISMLAEVY